VFIFAPQPLFSRLPQGSINLPHRPAQGHFRIQHAWWRGAGQVLQEDNAGYARTLQSPGCLNNSFNQKTPLPSRHPLLQGLLKRRDCLSVLMLLEQLHGSLSLRACPVDLNTFHSFAGHLNCATIFRL
jgi:hypothetical protein